MQGRCQLVLQFIYLPTNHCFIYFATGTNQPFIPINASPGDCYIVASGILFKHSSGFNEVSTSRSHQSVACVMIITAVSEVGRSGRWAFYVR